MANSVDPDQTPRSAASDLGLHSLTGLSISKLSVDKVVSRVYIRICKYYEPCRFYVVDVDRAARLHSVVRVYIWH